MAIQFVIDSASDFDYQEAKEKGLTFLPMKVIFGKEEFLDGVEINHQQFFEKLIESSLLPSTSQISPYEFEQAFASIVEKGDTAIAITVSSKLSGTYQSARIAADHYPGKVFVVDSFSACIGEQILIRYALTLREQGLDAEALTDKLNHAKTKICLLALLDTLEYLKKGGRISAVTAIAGGLLSIKPVVSIEDGAVSVVGKARGSKQGNNLLMELVQKYGGIDFQKPYSLAYSGLDDTLLKKYITDSRLLWENNTDRLPICTIGSAIGTHAGPGAIALAFFGKL